MLYQSFPVLLFCLYFFFCNLILLFFHYRFQKQGLYHKRKIICPLLFLSCLLAKTPFEYTIGITGGYDINVMRFSSEEFDQSAMDSYLMGGAKTFDSFVYRICVSCEKLLWKSMKKEFSLDQNLAFMKLRTIFQNLMYAKHSLKL